MLKISNAYAITERLYANYDTILSKSGNEELQASWLKARILAGLTDVTGPGVQITLLDAKEISGSESATIIHDQDVLYVVDTLRALGSYAISINGERIVTTSMIICNGPSIKINRKFCPIPIVITAVGDPDTIAAYLESDSYLLRRKADGIRVSVERPDTVVVPAYRETQYIEQQISLLEVTRYEEQKRNAILTLDHRLPSVGVIIALQLKASFQQQHRVAENIRVEEIPQEADGSE